MRLLRIAMLAATLFPLVSHAMLGGAPGAGTSSSPTTLRATPQSSIGTVAAKTAAAVPYTMRESRDANGVTIREYVLPSNVVFAVTWNGPIRPDMTALLGSYFPTYVSAGESRARGTGPLVEGSDDFRIESAGRLGRFTGAAYLPRLMPANVHPGDLQ
ncbi:DUF2844 domain-containing protein [Paraburkholderia sediminicola]|uniref:DUF2844 domain-containing protein n=1 Tax=Paraburkholderia sediminicola TaxID=458836 RepID=UPI0038BBEFE7